MYPYWLFRVTTNNEIIEKNLSLKCSTPAQKILFTDKTLKESLQNYLNKNFTVRATIEFSAEVNGTCLIKIVGLKKFIDSALKDLLILFTSCRTKTFNEPKG